MGLLTLLLLLCFGLDVSNPLLPGAVRFNPDESVDVVHATRLQTGAAIIRVVSRPEADRIQPRVDPPAETLESPPRPPVPAGSFAARRPAREPQDLASLSEDHH